MSKIDSFSVCQIYFTKGVNHYLEENFQKGMLFYVNLIYFLNFNILYDDTLFV